MSYRRDPWFLLGSDRRMSFGLSFNDYDMSIPLLSLDSARLHSFALVNKENVK